MKFKGAVIRTVRTLLQGVLGLLTVFLLAVKADGTFVNIKVHGEVLVFGAFLVAGTALVTFIQNIIEDNFSPLRIPKDQRGAGALEIILVGLFAIVCLVIIFGD